ncbi:hypothetical protein Aperf_G00000078790 [Anoplocephala perfoliata]
MPMLLADQKSGTRFTALKSSDQYRKAPLPSYPLLAAALSKWSINPFSSSTHLWHCSSAFLYVSEASTSPNIQTIRAPLGRYRNVGSMSQNRTYFSSVLVLIILASLLPTKAAGLGLPLQQHNSAQHLLQSSPFYDPDRLGSDSVPPVDDSTIKIRTRDPSPAHKPAQLGGPPIDQFLYSAPPVESSPQQPAYVPLLFPGPYYYPFYGSAWSYPETYGQYNPVSRTNRRKSGNKKRRDRYKSERCPKVCDTCVRMQERDLDQEKERDELQKRFATHVKPSLQHRNSVEALFKYMDGNDDGSVSLTELQNYLLLHNIISPDIPQ